MKRVLGFTLVELMITILVLAILLTIGVPSFQTMIQNNRLTSQVNEFISSLLYARSEAVRRNVNVIVCATTDGSSCGGAGTNWETGWITFADIDDDGVIDTGDCTGTNDCVLNVNTGVGGNTLRGYPAGDIGRSIAYGPTGTSSESGTFILCDSRGASHAKGVVVSATGRPRTSPTKADGSALSCP